MWYCENFGSLFLLGYSDLPRPICMCNPGLYVIFWNFYQLPGFLLSKYHIASFLHSDITFVKPPLLPKHIFLWVFI